MCTVKVVNIEMKSYLVKSPSSSKALSVCNNSKACIIASTGGESMKHLQNGFGNHFVHFMIGFGILTMLDLDH